MTSGPINNHPPVAKCKNVTVTAGPNCTADANIDDGSFDVDGASGTLAYYFSLGRGLGDRTFLAEGDLSGARAALKADVSLVKAWKADKAGIGEELEPHPQPHFLARLAGQTAEQTVDAAATRIPLTLVCSAANRGVTSARTPAATPGYGFEPTTATRKLRLRRMSAARSILCSARTSGRSLYQSVGAITGKVCRIVFTSSSSDQFSM